MASTSSAIPPGDALVLVRGDGCDTPVLWLGPFSAALSEARTVWLLFGDLPPSSPLPDAVLPALSAACSVAARVGKPTADFVPLVPRLAALGKGGGGLWKVLGGGEGNDDSSAPVFPPPLITSVVVGSEGQKEEASALALRIEDATESSSSSTSSPSSVAVVVVAPPASTSSFPASLPRRETATSPSTSSELPSPPFDQVAVGGTFDRLHAGHRLLLAASALAAEKRLFIGVTADKLLASKKHAELLQPYEERCAAAEAFARKVRPDPTFRIDVAALVDPNEPTGAETDPEMKALVVSKETIAGGEAINEGRKQRGFRPLVLLVVGLVGGGASGGGGSGGDEDVVVDVGSKISSTELRAAEAEARKGVAH